MSDDNNDNEPTGKTYDTIMSALLVQGIEELAKALKGAGATKKTVYATEDGFRMGFKAALRHLQAMNVIQIVEDPTKAVR